MFLSDELINLGKNANPKSNMEMGRQSILMSALLNSKKEEGINIKNLHASTAFAVKELNKLGYNYYTVDMFFTKTTNK